MDGPKKKKVTIQGWLSSNSEFRKSPLCLCDLSVILFVYFRKFIAITQQGENSNVAESLADIQISNQSNQTQESRQSATPAAESELMEYDEENITSHGESDESDTETATNVSLAADSSYDKEYRECIESFHVFDRKNKKLKYVRCKLCASMPNIVKLNSDNNKMAPLTTKAGCRFRRTYLVEHFQSKYHKACKTAINVPSNAKGSIGFHISKADEKLVSHVTKLLFDVYVDAKKLTISAFSWPARFVGAEAGRTFDCKDNEAPTVSPSLNLQYVNQPSHLSLLTTIVQSHKNDFYDKITNSIACSIRMDGSVDRTQIDKIYIMLVIITANGEKELTFLGIAEQTERKAVGLFEAVKKGMIENLGDEL